MDIGALLEKGGVTRALAALAVFVPVLLLMRDDQRSVGLRPLGEQGVPAAQESLAPELGTAVAEGPGRGAFSRAMHSPVFWLLSGSFFICGAASNGIVGVHFIPHSIDHGIPEVTTAGGARCPSGSCQARWR